MAASPTGLENIERNSPQFGSVGCFLVNHGTVGSGENEMYKTVQILANLIQEKYWVLKPMACL
jgi:hypothetical protein